MKGQLSRFHTEQNGVIALEACVSLTLFLLVMLTLYSLLRMFTIQSMISHALQEACQSIALENYSGTELTSQISNELFGLITGNSNSFWRQSSDFSAQSNLSLSKRGITESNYAKTRFAAYLAGDETGADELLKNYGVVNGLDGMSFSGTKNTGTDMVIEVKYKVRLIFYLEIFKFGEFSSNQKVCYRLWS